jgi:hypothetical protein
MEKLKAGQVTDISELEEMSKASLALRDRLIKKEEELKRLLKEIDAFQKKLDDIKVKVTKAKKEYADVKKAYDQEVMQLKQNHAKVKEQRDSLEAEIDKTLLTKYKNIKQKGDIDEGYMSLSSTLQSNYESIFGDIFDCVLTGYIDRELEEETVQVGDDEKKIRHATGEIRKLYLRGNTFIDAGCRFKDGSVPEFIIFDQLNMAKTFIDTLETGMRLSMSGAVTEKEFTQIQTEDKKPTAKAPEPPTESQEDLIDDITEDEPSIDVEHNKQLKAKVAGKYKTATAEQKAQVKEILGKYGAAKLDETKPTQMFEDILAIL